VHKSWTGLDAEEWMGERPRRTRRRHSGRIERERGRRPFDHGRAELRGERMMRALVIDWPPAYRTMRGSRAVHGSSMRKPSK